MRYRVGLATRDRIVDAARSLLAEGGWEAATVKAICDLADVRSGSFYNLFDSKEQLILTVVGEAIGAVDPHPTGVGGDTVADLVDAYVRFVTEQETMARVYLLIAVGGGLTDPAIGHRVLRHHEQRVGRFAAALAGAGGPDEALVQAEAMVAALNGYAIHFLLDPRFDFAGHASRLVTADAR